MNNKKNTKTILLSILLISLTYINNNLNTTALTIAGWLAGFIGSLFGSLVLASILGWIYMKLRKIERTQKQKFIVILTIALIDNIVVLFRILFR